MEVLNDEVKDTATSQEKHPLSRSIYNFAGALMIVCGIVWLGSNYNFLSPQIIDTILSWQMLMVAIGVWLICTHNYISGGTLTALGVMLVVVDYFDIYISFEKLVLPLLLIVAGVSTIYLKGIKR